MTLLSESRENDCMCFLLENYLFFFPNIAAPMSYPEYTLMGINTHGSRLMDISYGTSNRPIIMCLTKIRRDRE